MEFGLNIHNVFGLIFIFIILLSLFYREPRNSKRRRVINVIVTIGTEKVIPSLKEVINQFEKLKLKYVIVSSNPLPFKNVIVVPKEEDGNKYKAIKFFVKNYVKENEWYAFFDDDSYPLDDNYTKEIEWAEKNGYVACNGILVPRPGKSKLCYGLEFIRYFNDLTRYRAMTGVLNKPFFGLHGELLLVKGKVLKEIWLNMKESITEDFAFSIELIKRGYKTWQSKTKVSIKSPNSISDLIKQRARWVKGMFYDSIRYKNFIVILFLLTELFVNVSFLPIHILLNTVGIFGLIASLYYFFVYFYGTFKSKFPIFLFPFIEVLSCFFTFKIKRFVVIDKT